MSLGRRFKTFESISINGREKKSRVITAKENVTTRLKIATSKPLKARESSIHSIENCVICFVVVIVVVDLMVMVLLLLYYSKVDSQSQNNQEEEEHVEPTVVYQEEGMLSSAMILESHCM